MSGIGSTELVVLLLLLLVAGLILNFALRGRVSRGLLIVLIVVLSPFIAGALALLLIWTLDAIPIRLR
jgi:hypothetical protein